MHVCAERARERRARSGTDAPGTVPTGRVPKGLRENSTCAILGGMPKTTTENATLPVTMRLTPRLLGRLDEAAEREGVGRVEWIRAAIVAALRAAGVR